MEQEIAKFRYTREIYTNPHPVYPSQSLHYTVSAEFQIMQCTSTRQKSKRIRHVIDNYMYLCRDSRFVATEEA